MKITKTNGDIWIFFIIPNSKPSSKANDQVLRIGVWLTERYGKKDFDIAYGTIDDDFVLDQLRVRYTLK